MESNPCRVRGDSENPSNFDWGQFLPRAQLNNLAVGLRKLSECPVHHALLQIALRVRKGESEFHRQALIDRGSELSFLELLEEDVARDTKEPESPLETGRHRVDASPRHEKCLRQSIGGFVAIGAATKEVLENVRSVHGEQHLEFLDLESRMTCPALIRI